MTFAEWEKSVPEAIKADSLWKMKAYRLATLLGDLSWYDVTKLIRDRRTIKLADQLYEAVGSIGANLAEGYSMSTGKNRARYYEYSLGSTRESRDWYNKARHVLGNTVSYHRIELLSEIIRLLLTTLPSQREISIREDAESYSTDSESGTCDSDTPELQVLLENIPLP